MERINKNGSMNLNVDANYVFGECRRRCSMISENGENGIDNCVLDVYSTNTSGKPKRQRAGYR